MCAQLLQVLNNVCSAALQAAHSSSSSSSSLTLLPPAPQVPLVLLTEYLKKRLKSDTWGNYLFWITFCMVGQPVSVLTYYHDWVVLHRGA